MVQSDGAWLEERAHASSEGNTSPGGTLNTKTPDSPGLCLPKCLRNVHEGRAVWVPERVRVSLPPCLPSLLVLEKRDFKKIKFNQESDMRGIWELSLVMNASSHCGGWGWGWWWSRCFVSVWMIDVSAWREDALKVEMTGSVLTGSDGGILVPRCLNLLLQRFSLHFKQVAGLCCCRRNRKPGLRRCALKLSVALKKRILLPWFYWNTPK